MSIDFRLRQHGNKCTLTPLTARARFWVEAELDDQSIVYGGAAEINRGEMKDVLDRLDLSDMVVEL